VDPLKGEKGCRVRRMGTVRKKFPLGSKVLEEEGKALPGQGLSSGREVGIPEGAREEEIADKELGRIGKHGVNVHHR